VAQPTFLFHDYETWGINPATDRPSQFAAVRTTLDLEPVGDPINWLCKPTADMLPHPIAAKVTGLSPLVCFRKGMDEPQFFDAIHNQMSQPETCVIGYNSIRFDDEVTRYGFYRNFFEPYEREYKDGNSRWDLIDVVRTAWAIRPEGISWPKKEDGRISFKLEDLSAANGISHENAHDALNDVYATIALASKIREAQPKLFAYLYSHRQKQALQPLIDFESKKPLLHISGRISQDTRHCALMMPLMPHPTNKSGVIMLDLMQPAADYASLTTEEWLDRLYRPQVELDAEGIVRPRVKVVYLNKSPILLPMTMLGEAECSATGIDLELCRKNWADIASVAGTLATHLTEVYSAPYKGGIDDPEAKLYDGFLGNADKHKLKKVRESAPEALAADSIVFDDPRYQALLLRYLGRHYPQVLSEQQIMSWRQICADRLQGDQFGPTPEDYLTQLEEMASSGDKRLENLSRDLYQWGQLVFNG